MAGVRLTPEGFDARVRRLLGAAIPPLTQIPGYRSLSELGRGGIGVVYRARRERDGAIVALKIVHATFAATEARRRRLQNGAALAMTLKHPHIVRVNAHGEAAQGQLFVDMELVEGRNLAQALDDPTRPRPAAAPLMVKIARAVQHAHQGGVLHRDLKPANILMDDNGEPHLTDFDLALPVEQSPSQLSRHIVGTLPYMAPEQLSGEATFRTDVYSLGLVLYELLTGVVPFGSDSPDSLVADRIRTAPPVPPRAHDRQIDPRLQTICLKCLEKKPAWRYESAGALADDIERAQRGEPIAARPRSAPVRAWRWTRRHPRASAGACGALLLAVVTSATALSMWRAEVHEQARVLETNAFVASGQAGALLFQLRTYADRVERAARAPVVRSLLQAGQIVDPSPAMQALAGGFDSVVLETAEGRIVAQFPSPAPFVFGRTYAFRDYFRGARQLAQTGSSGVYVARAFRSESHGSLGFALSAPVMDDRGQQLGLIAATISAKAAFGAVRMQESGAERERITTALLGPRGCDRGAGPETAIPARFSFLVHPDLDDGVEYSSDAPSPDRLRAVFGSAAPPGEQFALEYATPLEVADYRDPIPGFGGPWLAAFAPVGKTGFFVLVETRKDGLRWPALLGRGRATAAALALVLALFAAGTIVTIRRRG